VAEREGFYTDRDLGSCRSTSREGSASRALCSSVPQLYRSTAIRQGVCEYTVILQTDNAPLVHTGYVSNFRWGLNIVIVIVVVA
jgi:hypothetical protein